MEHRILRAPSLIWELLRAGTLDLAFRCLRSPQPDWSKPFVSCPLPDATG